MKKALHEITVNSQN